MAEPQQTHARTWIDDGFTGACATAVGGTLALRFLLGAAAPAWAVMATSIQYPIAEGTFAAGLDDGYAVAFVAASLTVLRKFFMEVVLAPLAAAGGVKPGGDRIKFKQQGWVLAYYSTAFMWGLSEIMGSSYWMDTAALWRGYPHTASMSPSFKLYFVCQLAFWIHMVFVTLVEPWQKDFVVMIVHHFITIGMLGGAYGFGVLTVTHAILVEQDFADIFLPAAKLCNYIAAGSSAAAGTFQTIADVLFALFAVAWIPTRHVILPMIYYSIVTEAEEGLAAGGCNCGDGEKLVYNPEMGCTITPEGWGTILQVYTVALAVFQVLLLIWLKEILAAVYTALVTGDLQEAEKSSNQLSVELQDTADGAEQQRKRQ
jgi:acyl-CoA-dependent ceramide synthase